MREWTASLYATLLASLCLGCTAVDVSPRSLSTAVWEFIATLPDSVCRSCDTIFVHPMIVSGYDGPVLTDSGRGSSTALPYAAGQHKRVAGKALVMTPLDQLDPRPGRLALAAHLRGVAPKTVDRGVRVVIEIYVARNSRWELWGAVVGVGSTTKDGWSVRFSEIGWT